MGCFRNSICFMTLPPEHLFVELKFFQLRNALKVASSTTFLDGFVDNKTTVGIGAALL